MLATGRWRHPRHGNPVTPARRPLCTLPSATTWPRAQRARGQLTNI